MRKVTISQRGDNDVVITIYGQTPGQIVRGILARKIRYQVAKLLTFFNEKVWTT